MIFFRSLLRRQDLLVGVVLVLATFALYVKTLAPTLLAADAAEFQLACYTLGIAHPTGYPLYLMLGWLWSHVVPLGDVAHRINMLSAVFAASAVGLLYVLVVNVLRKVLESLPDALCRAVAVVATLSLAVSRTFWSQAVRAEVYALNSLFVVLTLLLLLHWADSRSRRALQVAALVYGLSLTHHITMILFLPAGLVFVWLVGRSLFRNLRLLVTLFVLVLAPLILYLYIPWRAPLTPYLHIELAPGDTLELYENTLRGFVGFVTGEMFRGELGYQGSVLERLTMAADLLLRQFGLAGIALGLLGLVKLALPQGNTASRQTVALVGLSYVAVVGFTLFYYIGDIEALYTPSYILFTVWMTLGMGWLVDTVRSARLGVSPGAQRWRAWGLIGVLALLPLSLLWANYSRVDRSADYRAREWAEEILSQPIPEGAILVSNDRNEITPLLYLQHVEGYRPDLLTMFPLMLPGEEYSNVVRVVDGVLDVDRPIYLLKPMPGLEIKYHMEPLGSLVEVAGPAITAEPEHEVNVALDDTLTLVGHDLEPEELSPGQELTVSLYWRANGDLEEDYHTYVHLLDDEGQAIAQSDHRPGQEYYPSSLWQPGETQLDVHLLSVPTDADGLDVTLVTGAYEYPSLVPLGTPVTVGQLSIAR